MSEIAVCYQARSLLYASSSLGNMPPKVLRTLIGSHILVVILLRTFAVSAAAGISSPKVFSLTFKKQQHPKNQIRDGLLKRQKSFSTDINYVTEGYGYKIS